MPKEIYLKPALTYQQQLVLLKNRGLNVEDEAKALHILETVSYYRLSAYWYQMMDSSKGENLFRVNSSFDTAFMLYCFDKDLRKLIINEIEKIEISIRAKIIYILSNEHSPFWFENINLFVNKRKHELCLEKLQIEYSRNNEFLIRLFKENFANKFPPSWILMEVTSFGTLSSIYKNLRNSHSKKKIAEFFGLQQEVFESWLHTLVYVRNICMHHSRFWNIKLSVSPKKVRRPVYLWIKNDKVKSDKAYYFLCILKYFINKIHRTNKLTIKLEQLIAKYPNINIEEIGFDPEWKKEVFWNS
ncbi:MAG: Abi family protein [Ignavibacteria bacterium]|nr:Abi family protein [Ignavibacteria bacterium]